MRTWLVAGAMLGALALGWARAGVAADELAAPKAADWIRGGAVQLSDVDVDGQSVVQLKGLGDLTSKVKLPVDAANKSYRLTGEFRALPGTTPARFYFGLGVYDAAGANIGPQHVLAEKGTDTELARDAKAGDDALYVKDGAAWKTNGSLGVAFNTDKAGTYADLPNRAISPQIAAVEKQDDGTFRVALKAKLPKDYPAGTPVREHRFSGTYIYAGASNVTLPAEWKAFSGDIKGEALADTAPGKWWRGTKQATIVILGNRTGDAESGMQFRNVKLEEVN